MLPPVDDGCWTLVWPWGGDGCAECSLGMAGTMGITALFGAVVKPVDFVQIGGTKANALELLRFCQFIFREVCQRPAQS